MIRHLLGVTLVAAWLLLSGCTAKLTEPTMNFEPPAYVEQMPPRADEQEFANSGSLFGRGDNPLFSDHKAMHVNDVVTVVISEATSSSHQSAKSTAESDTTSLGGGTFSAGGGNSTVASLASQATGLTNIGFSADSSNSYTGQGSYSRDASFSTTVTARIIKVLQNGNYYISGRREIMIDEEKQIIQLSGVIRPYDIDQNNQVDSTKMGDAKIYYSSQGDLDRATKQGWGSKLLQAAWPF